MECLKAMQNEVFGVDDIPSIVQILMRAYQEKISEKYKFVNIKYKCVTKLYLKLSVLCLDLYRIEKLTVEISESRKCKFLLPMESLY